MKYIFHQHVVGNETSKNIVAGTKVELYPYYTDIKGYQHPPSVPHFLARDEKWENLEKIWLGCPQIHYKSVSQLKQKKNCLH